MARKKFQFSLLALFVVVSLVAVGAFLMRPSATHRAVAVMRVQRIQPLIGQTTTGEIEREFADQKSLQLKLVHSDLLIEQVLADPNVKTILLGVEDPKSRLKEMIQVSVDDDGWMEIWIEGRNADMQDGQLIVNRVCKSLIDLGEDFEEQKYSRLITLLEQEFECRNQDLRMLSDKIRMLTKEANIDARKLAISEGQPIESIPEVNSEVALDLEFTKMERERIEEVAGKIGDRLLQIKIESHNSQRLIQLTPASIEKIQN